MSEFIHKAIENEPFNNFGSTSKASKTSFANTPNKNNNTINAAGQVVATNNKNELENNILIDPQRGPGSSLSTSTSQCPGSQTRVGLTTDLSFGECGCWVDTGVSLLDIVGAGGVDTVWQFITRGLKGGQKAAAIKSVIDRIKAGSKFDEYWDNLLNNLQQQKKALLDFIGLEGNRLQGIRNRILFAENNLLALQEQKENLISSLIDAEEYIASIQVRIDELILIGKNPSEVFLKPGFTYSDLINQLQDQAAILRQKRIDIDRSIASSSKGVDDLRTQFNLDLAVYQGQKLAYEDIIDELSNFDANKQNALNAIENAANNEVNNMDPWTLLQTAAAAVGVTISNISLSRKKICFGENVRLNESTCDCECVDPNMTQCTGQNTVSNIILGFVLPDIDELQTYCSLPCCGGQVKYQFGNEACKCACLGDITLGTVIGGGGSADDTWKEGSGCDCLQPGFLWSTRGKCVSLDVENRALAQGKVWDGSVCDFVCPNGPPAPCQGNTTRPPAINYNGFILEDECGACVPVSLPCLWCSLVGLWECDMEETCTNQGGTFTAQNDYSCVCELWQLCEDGQTAQAGVICNDVCEQPGYICDEYPITTENIDLIP